ncbi:MAG: 4Fe-4S dicluster domain-containing protein, partial [Chloroflexota bacterium]
SNASDHELTEMINWPPVSVLGGLGNVEAGKPVLTFMGDNFLTSWYAIRHLQEKGLADKVEVCGIGSVAHDIIRFYDRCRVLSPMVPGRKMVRYGISDILVASTACVNWDFLPDARLAGTKVIWTSKERNLGLPDRTDDPVDRIVNDIAEGAPGAWVRDVEKAAEVAVGLLPKVKRDGRKLLSEDDAKRQSKKCKANCDLCLNACPNGLLVGPAVRKVKDEGLKALSKVEDGCYLCGACEQVCPEKIPLLDLIVANLGLKAPQDKLKMRAGRGTVPRVETTGWAFGSMWGNCPGIFHILGCGDARSRADLGWLAYEMVWRNAIVFVGGCGAGEVGRYFNEKKQQYVFEEFGAEGQARNMMNCGACSACVHIADQAIKWPRSGAGISFYANYAESADCHYNLLAPTLIVWGALPDRMYAIVAAWVRAGMAAVVGPNSAFSYKRHMLRSKWQWEDWWTLSQFGGRRMVVEPAPFAMILPVETKEEAITMALPAMMRPADIRDNRQIRLDTYVEYYEKFFGEFPDDWHLFVRSDWELPMRYKSRLLRVLRENRGWDIDRLRVKRARHPDGRLLDMGAFGKEYGAMAMPVTRLPRLVARTEAPGGRSKEVMSR